jgi:hypothetical protein
MSNAITENNGQSAIRGLENVVIHNTEQPKSAVTEKKAQNKKAGDLKPVESASIQEVFVDKYNCILRYQGTKVFLMQSKGEKQVLLGEMTVKGLSRNVHIAANLQILDLITIANRKFSPVSKAEQDERKIQKMNEARAIIAGMF